MLLHAPIVPSYIIPMTLTPAIQYHMYGRIRVSSLFPYHCPHPISILISGCSVRDSRTNSTTCLKSLGVSSSSASELEALPIGSIGSNRHRMGCSSIMRLRRSGRSSRTRRVRTVLTIVSMPVCLTAVKALRESSKAAGSFLSQLWASCMPSRFTPMPVIPADTRFPSRPSLRTILWPLVCITICEAPSARTCSTIWGRSWRTVGSPPVIDMHVSDLRSKASSNLENRSMTCAVDSSPVPDSAVYGEPQCRQVRSHRRVASHTKISSLCSCTILSSALALLSKPHSAQSGKTDELRYSSNIRKIR